MKFRLLLMFSGLAVDHGVTEMGPLLAGRMAMVEPPCLIVRLPLTDTGVNTGKSIVAKPRLIWT